MVERYAQVISGLVVNVAYATPEWITQQPGRWELVPTGLAVAKGWTWPQGGQPAPGAAQRKPAASWRAALELIPEGELDAILDAAATATAAGRAARRLKYLGEQFGPRHPAVVALLGQAQAAGYLSQATLDAISGA